MERSCLGRSSDSRRRSRVSPPVAARQSEAAEERKPLKTIFGSHLQQAEASIAPRIGKDRLLLCGHFSRLKGWKNAMSTRPDRDGWAKGFIAHFQRDDDACVDFPRESGQAGSA